MKKYAKFMTFIFLLIILFSLSGCDQTGIEPVIIDYEAIQSVIDDIDFLPNEVTLLDKEFIDQIRTKYEALVEEDKKLVTNINALIDAEEQITYLINYEKNTNEILEKAVDEIKAFIPDKTNANFSLPNEYETDQGTINIRWSTSDPYTLLNNGVIIQGRKDITATLTAIMTLGKYQTSFSKEVVVQKINLKSLPANDKVFAYMYAGSFKKQYKEDDLATIDVVNLSFAGLINGEVNTSSLGDTTSILSQRQKSNIRVLFCIMGYSSGSIPISQAASTDASRKKLATSIVLAIEKYHFDGIDMDWEYPGYNTGVSTSIDRANYTLLMKEIYIQVKAANADYIVSGAIPGSTSSSGLASRYNVADVAPYMDFIHLMTYDMNSGGTTSHHTSYASAISTVNTYVALGAKKSQLTIGIAFYGKIYTITGSGVLGTSARNAKTISYDDISMYLKNVNGTTIIRYWDSSASAPYLYIQDSTGKYFVTYDDSESISMKCLYARNNGLAGVMFWEYGENQGGQLVSAIKEVYGR